MARTSKTGWEPACMPDQPGTCAECDLAYDCQTKMSGRLVAWPVVALVVAGVLALIVN